MIVKILNFFETISYEEMWHNWWSFIMYFVSYSIYTYVKIIPWGTCIHFDQQKGLMKTHLPTRAHITVKSPEIVASLIPLIILSQHEISLQSLSLVHVNIHYYNVIIVTWLLHVVLHDFMSKCCCDLCNDFRPMFLQTQWIVYTTLVIQKQLEFLRTILFTVNLNISSKYFSLLQVVFTRLMFSLLQLEQFLTPLRNVWCSYNNN